ncbi:DsbA family protein [uncultured Amaricoccus sp.]|uniref:DsbA family protein n=1 Tax=uncultured Amaricoccus sp. TaxID=339341 RepID=UPI00260E78D6|nr:DsbA family protein [uncultured Amaricoccus sp.]
MALKRLVATTTILLLAATLAPAGATDAAKSMSEAERAAFRAEVHDYLLANPEVLMEMLALLDARQKAAADKSDAALVSENAAPLFQDGYSYVAGNPDGAFTIVEFVDYQCGYCRKSFTDVHDMVDADGDIRLIVKDFPILGPGSDLAARAAIATMISQGPEAYGRLNATLMGLREPVTDASLDRALAEADLDPAAVRAGMGDPEIDRRLAQNKTLAQTLAITGTPTFVVDSKMVRGYVPRGDLEKLVQELRTAN